MKDENLDDTMPIKSLKDIQNTSRASKYADVSLDEEETRVGRSKISEEEEEKKKHDEEAEEALAEKNIALAESYAEKEKKAKNVEDDEDDDDDEDDKKENLFVKLKNKWKSLSKKKKIIIGVVAGLILIGLIVLIIFLVKGSKKNDDVKPTIDEVAPTIVDNYYYKDGSLYFLNDDEDEIGSYECENKDEKLCYVAINDVSDTFDIDKYVLESGDKVTQRMPIYSDDFVFVVDSKQEKANEVILYSIKEDVKKDTFGSVKAYEDNYIIYSQDQKYGLAKIDSSFEDVIEPKYDYLGKIDGEDNLVAKTSKGVVVVSEKDKSLSKNIANIEVKDYDSDSIIGTINGEYNVYDYEGKLIVGGVDFAKVEGGYVAVVQNKKLKIYDTDKVKYNEDGIELKKNSYVKEFVYDDNGTVISKNISFSYEKQGKDIVVAVYSEDKEDPDYINLSIAEAEANKNYDYINYFDKKLYFYKDEEKEELLGSYLCATENESPGKLDSCYIAKDKIIDDNDSLSPGYRDRNTTIPILNEKFVFISDGGIINLYDLVKSEKLSSYSSVNTYLPGNDNKITHYNGDVIVIALNKKGKYGAIKIDETGANGCINFQYLSMEKVGSKIIAQDGSNTWKLFYDENNSSPSYTGKVEGFIKNYNYVKTKDGSSYSVYKGTGEKISSGYQYVELYDNYYAAVTDGKLSLYKYDGSKMIKNDYTLNSKDFAQVDMPAFKVEEKNNEIIVYILKSGSYVRGENIIPTDAPVEETESEEIEEEKTDA